jgi:hypothetical protein
MPIKAGEGHKTTLPQNVQVCEKTQVQGEKATGLMRESRAFKLAWADSRCLSQNGGLLKTIPDRLGL